MKGIIIRLKKLFIDVPRLAWALSKNLVHFVKLFFALAYFLITRQSVFRGEVMSFNFFFNETSFALSLYDPVDISALIEIFVLREYDWRLKSSPETILDLGAHWGDTTLYYKLVYPDAVIMAVEPMPEMYVRLERLKEKYQNLQVVRAALTAQGGEVEIYKNDSFLGSSTIHRSGGHAEKVVVPAVTIDQLKEMADVDYFDLIKFDIEGAEEILFLNQNLKSLAKAYIGEIHLDLINLSLQQIKDKFSDFDVSFTKISPTRYIFKAVSLVD